MATGSSDEFSHADDPISPIDPSRRAGFGIRVVATLLDALVLSPATAAEVYILVVSKSAALKSVALLGLLAVPRLFYKPLMEWRYGATLGKMICRIRVIASSGKPLSLGAAFLRSSPIWLITIASLLPLVNPGDDSLLVIQKCAAVAVAIDVLKVALREKRAVHDALADSYCVWK
jgi:uncharacterized RDD family membrane protein YckC